MPHPNFFGFWARPPGWCPDGPRRPAVLRADHARMRARFSAQPPLVLEPDVGRIAPCLSNRCQPAPERGRGGFRMGRTQPHRIAGHGPAAAPIFSTQPPVMLSACSGPPGQKATQPAPRRAAHGQKGFAGPFHTKLRRAHDFGGHVP